MISAAFFFRLVNRKPNRELYRKKQSNYTVHCLLGNGKVYCAFELINNELFKN